MATSSAIKLEREKRKTAREQAVFGAVRSVFASVNPVVQLATGYLLTNFVVDLINSDIYQAMSGKGVAGVSLGGSSITGSGSVSGATSANYNYVNQGVPYAYTPPTVEQMKEGVYTLAPVTTPEPGYIAPLLPFPDVPSTTPEPGYIAPLLPFPDVETTAPWGWNDDRVNRKLGD